MRDGRTNKSLPNSANRLGRKNKRRNNSRLQGRKGGCKSLFNRRNKGSYSEKCHRNGLKNSGLSNKNLQNRGSGRQNGAERDKRVLLMHQRRSLQLRYPRYSSVVCFYFIACTGAPVTATLKRVYNWRWCLRRNKIDVAQLAHLRTNCG